MAAPNTLTEEIWESVLHQLDGRSLAAAEAACSDWCGPRVRPRPPLLRADTRAAASFSAWNELPAFSNTPRRALIASRCLWRAHVPAAPRDGPAGAAAAAAAAAGALDPWKSVLVER